MNLKRRALILSVSFLLIVAPLPASAQVRRAAPAATPIRERDIRAELGFLASDAMQGRGSGTNNERLAAEYIGSQFRSFGLEPGGDADNAGNKDFVQRVTLESTKFTAPPSFKVTSGSNTQTWQFGRDFLVSFLRATKINGDIQVIDSTGTPAKGAVVVIKSLADPQKRQDTIMKAYSAGAAAVVLLETENNKRTREAGNARLPSMPGRIAGDSNGNQPFAVISLRQEALDALTAMGDGAKAEFSGQTEATESRSTWNAIGILRGSDPKAASQVIVLSAHLDHLGINEAATGDKIFNGADDDASGCVAVLEMARVFASGRRPRRTIYFVCFGSEESGGHGSRYFIANLAVPLTDIVANINFEMLGRPDPKVPPATLWLTGFERSDLGPTLARRGAAIVADPHPEQNFFRRSDNYTLAVRGVVAHTVSSYGLHPDYHRPSDEIGKIDFPFMTRSLNSLVAPIRWLANSNFRPAWLPGKAPTR
jgi:Zn-dependent M28 family amino/carboxypeptidase